MNIEIDLQEDSQYKAYFEQGSHDQIVVTILDDDAPIDHTGQTGTLYLYNDVEDLSVYQIASTATTASNITFDITPAQIPTHSAVYRSEIVLTDSGNQYHRAYGKIIVRKSILIAGAGAIAEGVSVDFSSFTSYTSVDGSGPYLAGNNITFSSPDANGRVAINSSSGGTGQDDGIVDLTSGVSSVTVSGLGLSYTPTKAICTVMMPDASGVNLFATVILNTLTTDGFTVSLSGKPPASGYKLCYQIS